MSSDKQSMTIKFHRDLYKLPAIKTAAQAFAELADFQIKTSGKYFHVNISNTRGEVADVLSDEFSNYVLSLIKR
ncbi:MAG: HxsD-like protein [Planctomycetes bacterium]|jgi:hypothetical protein|nr:HxsD-like protein [Planctomycetota bacterium]